MPSAAPVPPTAHAAEPPLACAPVWDLFCRVVDNYGDVGVCWRLAAELGQRGLTVRLWIDDARALAWMAPEGAPGVSVHAWSAAADDPPAPGAVVIEAFGCDPPAAFVARMVAAEPAPVWINLEYLSAEAYVERSHGLPSPQWSGPGRGLSKHFFYPGFTPRTGGLIREADLPLAEDRPPGDELRLTLFCYAPAALPSLIDALAHLPADDDVLPPRARLGVTPGWAAGAVAAALGRSQGLAPGDVVTLGTLTAEAWPAVPQPEFDARLRAADLNFVRGEDSLVRAIWAGRPFVWQLYPQDDGAHAAKLAAFLALPERALAGGDPAPLATIWSAWNGLAEVPSRATWHAGLRALCGPAGREAAQRCAMALRRQDDLVTRLLAFVAARRGVPGAATG